MGTKDKWYIGKVYSKYEKKSNKALKVIGQFLVGDIKLRVVVDTGNLKNSIKQDDSVNLSVGVGTNVEYGSHVELGTEKQEAKPFLKPALDENIKDIQQLYTGIMSK